MVLGSFAFTTASETAITEWATFAAEELHNPTFIVLQVVIPFDINGERLCLLNDKRKFYFGLLSKEAAQLSSKIVVVFTPHFHSPLTNNCLLQ